MADLPDLRSKGGPRQKNCMRANEKVSKRHLS
jgi:hypothetical protein